MWRGFIGHSGAAEIAVRLENTSNAITVGDVRRVLTDASAYGIDMSAPAALPYWSNLYGSFGRGDLTIEFAGVEQVRSRLRAADALFSFAGSDKASATGKRITTSATATARGICLHPCGMTDTCVG